MLSCCHKEHAGVTSTNRSAVTDCWISRKLRVCSCAVWRRERIRQWLQWISSHVLVEFHSRRAPLSCVEPLLSPRLACIINCRIANLLGYHLLCAIRGRSSKLFTRSSLKAQKQPQLISNAALSAAFLRMRKLGVACV